MYFLPNVRQCIAYTLRQRLLYARLSNCRKTYRRIMTRNDARKLIKSRYLSNSAEKVLLRVLDLTYRKDKDNPELTVEATSASFQRAARVKTRQLFNIMTQSESDKLLLDVETGNHIRCRLNLEAI